eukprot:gene4287-4539_t
MSHSDQIKAHALSIVCGRALKKGRDVRSMCSMLQVSNSVKAAIISNARRNLALAVALIDQHSASVEDMAWSMFQAQWLSKYNVLVGELEVYMTDEGVDCECAALEALLAAVLPRLQLRHLSLTARATCMLLEHVNSVHLTSLDVQRPDSHEASFPISASLSRLSNLQQLSIGSLIHPTDPYPAGCFAGLPTRLTQLVVAFKLPAEAYGELPCQLRRLMLTCYNGSSITHLQQLSALALCHPEGPGQALAAAVNSLTGLRHLTLGLSWKDGHGTVLDVLTAMCDVPCLRDLRYQHAGIVAQLVAPIAKLTNLTHLVWEGDIWLHEEQEFLQMLQPLVQLEKLCFRSQVSAVASFRSFGDLFSKHLTKLQGLHVVLRKLQEPLFSQVLAAASGLTSLTLGYLECPDRDLGMIACSAPRLRELTLLLNCMDVADYERDVPLSNIGDPMTLRATMATLSSPFMPHLQGLTLSGSLACWLYPEALKKISSMRPHLQVQCGKEPGPESTDYLGCLAWRASPTVKVWDCA